MMSRRIYACIGVGWDMRLAYIMWHYDKLFTIQMNTSLSFAVVQLML